MDKNSHQRPIVIGPPHTLSHLHSLTCMRTQEIEREWLCSLPLFPPACKLRKCNVAVQNNNGNCVPTVQKSMFSQAPHSPRPPHHGRSLFSSFTLSGPPNHQPPTYPNEVAATTYTKPSRTFGSIESRLLNTPLNGRTTITDIKEPMEQSQQPGPNNGPDQSERELWLLSAGESESAARRSTLSYLLSPAQVGSIRRRLALTYTPLPDALGARVKTGFGCSRVASTERRTNHSESSCRAEQKQELELPFEGEKKITKYKIASETQKIRELESESEKIRDTLWAKWSAEFSKKIIKQSA